MMDFVATFQHWLTLACFVALAVCLFALAVLCAIPELTDAIRRFCGMDNFSKVVCGVCIVGAVLYGGSKGVNVRWDDGLRDNGTLITNDTVSVRWTYSGIPGASSVFIDYREAGTTNDWLNLAETLASAQEWTGTLANATNYDYWVYSTYVPPVPVHTNGVWVGQAYETKAKVGAAAFLILNGKVVADGRTIAPPKWAEPPPYDAEVEYLQSSGTQYIDTGARLEYPKIHTGVWYDRYRVQYTRFFGYYSSEAHNSIRLILQNSANNRGWVSAASKAGGSINVPLAANAWHDIFLDCTLRSCTIDGEAFTSANVGTRYVNNIYIFADNRGPTPNAVIRIAFFRIWDESGNLVFDGKPVRKDGVGYMYDRVSGQLFGNAGTGAFGVGPDK